LIGRSVTKDNRKFVLVQRQVQRQSKIIEDEELGGYKWLLGLCILNQRNCRKNGCRKYGSDDEGPERAAEFKNTLIESKVTS